MGLPVQGQHSKEGSPLLEMLTPPTGGQCRAGFTVSHVTPGQSVGLQHIQTWVSKTYAVAHCKRARPHLIHSRR